MKQKLLTFVFMMACVVGFSYAQTRNVGGLVTSALDGTPLSGVTVSVQGSSVATQTNEAGRYAIAVPVEGVLEFKSVGYLTVEITPSGSVANVVMEDGTDEIEAVVVTGYGTLKKKSFSGATSSIRMDDFSRQTVGSFDQALQAAAPGISVVGQSGQPGTNAIVRIRGNGSINGGNAPLYILDGFEISAADFSSMNSSDFASVDVLKDAISTALYGSRGANGVIVITSKKGQEGPLRINYRSQFGMSDLPKDRLKMMNSEQKVQYELDRGNPYGWTDAEADSLKLVNFSWADALLQTGSTQEHSIEALGGGQSGTFFGSLSYFNQDGIVKTTGLERVTTRVAFDGKKDNWKFGVNLNGGFSKRMGTSEGDTYLNSPLNAARWSNPYETAYLIGQDGVWNEKGGPGSLYSGQPNGLMELMLDYNWRNQLKGIGNTYVEFHVPGVEGLFLRTNWGVDYTQNESASFNDPRTSGAQARNGSLNRQMSRNFRYTGTTSVNYQKAFGDHEVSGGLFTEVVKNDYRIFGFTGYGFTNGFTNETGMTPGSGSNENYIPSVTGSGSQNGLLSYFLTANYGYAGKYYINLLGRRDGSSRFGINRRYANFGSVGVTWSISDEDFLKDVDFVTNLQYRMSYGTNGNTGESNYPIPMFGRTAYSGVSGWAPGSPGNLDLTWETNKTFNTGLSFGLWNSRIEGSVDYYNRETVDLFYNIPVDPSISGFTSILGNFGRLRNRGVEIELNVDVVRNENVKWSVGGNFTYNNNKILELPQDSVVSGLTILAEGKPVNSYFLVNYAGVNPENGTAQYYDLDGEIVEGAAYTPDYKVIHGTSDAPYFGGLSTSFSYKGIELAAQMAFFLGRDLYNNEMVNLTNPTYFFDNMSETMLDEWRTPGQITSVPRPSSAGGNAFQSQTTRFLENGDFWRLRNVTIAYNLPKTLLQRAKISNVRIFVQGQNWLTSTKFRNFDPEISAARAQTGAYYPSLVQTTFGLNIGF